MKYHSPVKTIILAAALLVSRNQILYAKEKNENKKEKPVLKQLDLYAGTEFSADTKQLSAEKEQTLYSEQQEAETEQKEKSLEIETVFSARTVTQHITAFVSAKGKDKEIFSSMNKGILFHTDIPFLNYKVSVMAGNIKTAGAASRLNDPRFTFSSALKNFAPPAQGFSPSLPTKDSSNRTESEAITFTPLNRKSFPKLEAVYTNRGNIMFSASSAFSTQKFPVIQTSFAAGFFRHSKTTSSWFSEIPLYRENYFPAAELSFTLTTRPVKTSAAFYAYRQPFSTNTLVPGTSLALRIHSTVTKDFFTLNTSSYFQSAPLITSDGTFVHTPLAVSINPQYSFILKQNTLRAGAAGAIECKTESFTSETIHPILKLRADTTYSVKNRSYAVHAQYTYTEENESSLPEQNITASTKISSTEKTFSWNTNLGANIKNIESQTKRSATYTAQAAFSFRRKNYTSISTSLSVTEKAGSFTGGNFKAGFSFTKQPFISAKNSRFSLKGLKISGKINFLVTF